MELPVTNKQLLFLIVLMNLLVVSYYFINMHSLRQSHTNGRTANSVENEQSKQFQRNFGKEVTQDTNGLTNMTRVIDVVKIEGDPIDYSQRHVINLSEMGLVNPNLILPDMNATSDFVQVAKLVFIYQIYYDARDRERELQMVCIAFALASDRGAVQCLFPGNIITNTTVYKSPEAHGLPFVSGLFSCRVPDVIDRASIRKHGVIILGTFSKGKILETHFNVTVHSGPVNKYDFNVCIPPLYGNIPLIRILEFIEVTTILGANHLTFYERAIDRELHNVLKQYADIGLVTLKQWRHGFNHNHVWYYGQSASIWDCLLENMYTSKYIVLNDIDEFIVPSFENYWAAMIENIKKKHDSISIGAFKFKSAVFDNAKVFHHQLTERPKYAKEIEDLITLTTTIREKETNGARTKLIVDPRKVYDVGIHTVYKFHAVKHRNVWVDERSGLVHHYRSFGGDLTSRAPVMVDKTIWKYYDNITQAVNYRKKWLKDKGIEI